MLFNQISPASFLVTVLTVLVKVPSAISPGATTVKFLIENVENVREKGRRKRTINLTLPLRVFNSLRQRHSLIHSIE
jgi:hypothetical protein